MTFQSVAWILPGAGGEARSALDDPAWKLWFVERDGTSVAAVAEAALAAGCDYLAFTREARPDLASRVKRLCEAAGSRSNHVALVADRGVELSFERGGVLRPRRTGGTSPVRSFPSPEAFVVRAEAYRAVSGLDSDLSSLAELDLAWRLALVGYDVEVLPLDESPAGSSADVFLGEHAPRDGLSVIYKCLSDAWLACALPFALAALLSTGTASAFQHVVRFGERLDRLREKRRRVQAARVVADGELKHYFFEAPSEGDGVSPLGELARELGLEALFDASREDGGVASRKGQLLSAHAHAHAHAPSPSSREPARNGVELSAIVVTATGSPHLEACLRSLAGQRFSRERLEVIAVDNGSPADPAPAVARGYPDARFVVLDKNYGFTGGYNRGAAEASGEWLAFVNDDVVLAPEWIASMLEVGRRRAAAAVASPVFGWSGRRLDFARGAVSFEGKGFQLAHGRPRWLARLDEEPVLFACGAAMIIRRDVFFELGGFDDAFFAYYEDVSLGWELWLRGYEVWLAPRASARHRQHQSASLLSEDERTRLYERNALSIVMTHLEPELRARALSASLLLLAKRALVDSLPARARALDAWLGDLPAMRSKRESIERHRKRSDGEALAPFASRWSYPSRAGRDYRRYHDAIVSAFELGSFPAASAGRQAK